MVGCTKGYGWMYKGVWLDVQPSPGSPEALRLKKSRKIQDYLRLLKKS